MSTERGGPPETSPGRSAVTRQQVKHLWAELIAGRRTWQQTSTDAQSLIDQVHAENRIVNDGLLWLYYLWQGEELREPAVILEARRRFREQLAVHDVDPAAWERRYFQRMLVSHQRSFGREKALRFGQKLVREALLSKENLLEALPERPVDLE